MNFENVAIALVKNGYHHVVSTCEFTSYYNHTQSTTFTYYAKNGEWIIVTGDSSSESAIWKADHQLALQVINKLTSLNHFS